jgi:hypothetical protein
MHKKRQPSENKEKNKCISLTHSSEVTFFTCITVLIGNALPEGPVHSGPFFACY